MEGNIENRVEYLDLPIGEIGTDYSKLRIVYPASDSAMRRSLRQYGQISPVIVGQPSENHYEMVDGFKRLRAGRELGFTSLKVRVLDIGLYALKAAIIHLNMRANTMADIEKALVIRSLHREDLLSQTEIAKLLGRHKSWVCRRLSLVERLCDEVLEHLKLGLINMTTGRELALLPRGNQPKVLRTILKYRLDTRETARLVAKLLKEPRWNHDLIIGFPEEILLDREPSPPRIQTGSLLTYDRLMEVEQILRGREFSSCNLPTIINENHNMMLDVIGRIEEALNNIKTLIDEAVN